MSRLRRRIVLGLSAVTTLALVTATPAVADKGWHGKPPTDLPKVPLMVGSGGAVSSVDREASQVGIDVLARGGNAADAAVATAAALGVTEPNNAGIGGGGFLVHHDAQDQAALSDPRPRTEPSPSRSPSPAYRVRVPEKKSVGTSTSMVNSGRSIGIPGTLKLAPGDRAATMFGTWRLAELLKPAEKLAEQGFVVDATFNQQTAANALRFSKFPETAKVFLSDG